MNSALLTCALLAANPPAPDASDSVRAGLEWLAKHQKPDGRWAGTGGLAPTLITATAGLALLMEGSTPKNGPYAPHIRKAVAWFEKRAADTGFLALEPNDSAPFVRNHATAMLFLLSVYEVDDDPDRLRRLGKLLEQAVRFATKHQTTSGGWNFVFSSSRHYDHSHSTGVMLQALVAARGAGFDVPQKVLDRAVVSLTRATTRDGGVIEGYFVESGPSRAETVPLATTSAAAGVCAVEGGRPDVFARWLRSAVPADRLQVALLRGGGWSEIIQQYHAARVYFALGENGHGKLDPELPQAKLVKWSAYRAPLFKALKEAQSKDGSWPDPVFGPAFPTAMALVILQLDNQFLPAFAR